jgi:hypothetical protein
MPFEKGKAGRPQGARSKRVFSLPNVVQSMFPALIPELTTRRVSVETAATSNGKKMFLRYLNGETLSPTKAIIANCFDCMGQYVDGRQDCKNPLCPLYPFMPYRKKENNNASSGCIQNQK